MSDPRPNDEELERLERERRLSVHKNVDSEWKRKVQREKERLSTGTAPAAPPEETAPPPKAAPKTAPPPARDRPKAVPHAATDMAFLAVVQQLADQAALFMGLVPGYAERNCEQALAAIEMLRALQEKTKGNLNAQESKALTQVVYELQMRYVESCGGGGPA